MISKNNYLLAIVILVSTGLLLLSVKKFFFVTTQPTTAPTNLPESNESSNKINRYQVADHQLIEIKLANQTFTVEVVNTPTSISQGLGNRDQLGADGMLFLMPATFRYGFWMKNMRFNLDFVWLKDDKVVEITQEVPAPESIDVSDDQLSVYYPSQTIDMVLEMEAGAIRAKGIQVGDQLLWPTDSL